MRSIRTDLTSAGWRKSSYSDGGGGDCVEVADGVAGCVPVRDSKNPAAHLCFPATAWGAFIADVKRTGRPHP